MPRLFLLMPKHLRPPCPHVRAPFNFILFFCYFIFVLKNLIKKSLNPIKSISWVAGVSIQTIICFSFLFNVFFSLIFIFILNTIFTPYTIFIFQLIFFWVKTLYTRVTKHIIKSSCILCLTVQFITWILLLQVTNPLLFFFFLFFF